MMYAQAEPMPPALPEAVPSLLAPHIRYNEQLPSEEPDDGFFWSRCTIYHCRHLRSPYSVNIYIYIYICI